MEKKDLYLGTSIEQLNKQVSKQNSSGKNSPRLEMLCRVSDRIYNKAKDIYKTIPLDEELTYIICLRYTGLVERIRLKEKDNGFHKSRFGKPLDFINDIKFKCEQSLIERYKELEATEVAVVNDQPSEIKRDVEITFSNGGDMFISSEALYKIMQANNVSVLIIDIRLKEEFAASAIKHTDVLNIPNNLIARGLSTNTLKQKLPPESLEIFEDRAKYEYIVIMDLETPSLDYSGSKLEELRSILTDWDLEENIGLILVLDGGLRAIVDTHPSVVNNLLFLATRIFNEFDEGFLADVHYPELLSETPEPVDLAEGVEEVLDVPQITEVPPLELEGEKSDGTTSSDISFEQNLRYDTLFGLYGQIQAQAENSIAVETELFELAQKRMALKKNILDKPEIVKRGFIKLKKISEDVSRAESTKINIHERKTLLENKVSELPEEVSVELTKIREDIQAIERKILLKYQSRKKIEQKEIAIDKEMRDRGLVVNCWEPMIELKKSNSRPDINRRLKPTDNKILELIPTLNTACKGTGLVGLYNIQNTCYLNSLIQCLRFCPPFIHHLTFVEQPSRRQDSSKITLFLVQLMLKLWNSNYNYVTPTNLYNEICRVDNNNIGYGLGRHEDVQEFFMFLMKYIHIEMYSAIICETNREYTSKLLDWHNNFNERESFVTRMFYHQLEMTTVCTKCEKSVTKFEYGNTVFINIENTCESVDIFHEMENYLSVKASEKSSRFCNDCEIETELTKRISYYPTILAVNIIRYYYDTATKMIRRSNIECHLNQKIYFGSCRYELKAVSLHHGDKDVGHYTALCYHTFQNRWIEFNDTKWNYSELDTASNRMRCYMLFYTIAHNPSEVNKHFFQL